MKILFLKKAKGVIGIFLCIFLFAVILLNVAGYFFDFKYDGIFAAMAQPNQYEVRSRLLMEALNEVGVCKPQQAAEVWASGLIRRSAALQYAVMNGALKEEYARQLEKNFPNWVTGISSPWVDSFCIAKTEKIDENSYIFYLILSTKTSTGPAGDFNARLTVVKEKDFWRITEISADQELFVYMGFDPNF